MNCIRSEYLCWLLYNISRPPHKPYKIIDVTNTLPKIPFPSSPLSTKHNIYIIIKIVATSNIIAACRGCPSLRSVIVLLLHTIRNQQTAIWNTTHSTSVIVTFTFYVKERNHQLFHCSYTLNLYKRRAKTREIDICHIKEKTIGNTLKCGSLSWFNFFPIYPLTHIYSIYSTGS